MAKINIAGVSSGSKDYTTHVVLTEDNEPGAEFPFTILGEAFVEIPWPTEPADVKVLIVDAAQGIMKKHKDAVDKKADLSEIDFPPIE